MRTPGSKRTQWMYWLAVPVVLACLCILAATVIGSLVAYAALMTSAGAYSDNWTFQESEGPVAPVIRPARLTAALETQRTLLTTAVPLADYYERDCRLWSLCDIPHTVHAPSPPYEVGERRLFWVQNSDTDEDFRVVATLRHVTEHSYLWIQEGLEFEQDDVLALATTFEERTYPLNRRIFGSEWAPGVDNDPHVYILAVQGIGRDLGGYFSSRDEYPPNVDAHSNAAEMFVVGLDGSVPILQDYQATLAHEFQHVIQWNVDRNETTWLNEGLSEMAVWLNGLDPDPARHAGRFARNPDTSLVDWVDVSDDSHLSSRHYPKAFLFIAYFTERFGEEALSLLAADRDNGLAAIDNVLEHIDAVDPLTGSPVQADDLVVDWMLTMALQDAAVGDGRYAYQRYPNAPRAALSRRIEECPQPPLPAAVTQYGADYIEITCPGQLTIEFTGSTAVPVLPADPHSGDYAFWSNIGDDAVMSITREFDLSGISGSIPLAYWAWHDIEEDADFLEVQASVDGKTWQVLKTKSCTDEDALSVSFYCDYTGRSGAGLEPVWIQDSVDLFSYGGKKVKVRFEYTSSTTHTGLGFLLDDIVVPDLNYSEGFEYGDGGWRAEGFARIQNVLPQTYRLALIHFGGAGTTIEPVELRADQTASMGLSLAGRERALLVITGTQRLAPLPSGYMIEVRSQTQ